jgi:hypothetical protein
MTKKAHNAADPEMVKAAEKDADLRRTQDLEDIRTILDTPAGVRFFTRFFKAGKIFSTSMTGNSWTFFNEGGRNLALSFFADVAEASPGKIASLVTLIKED